MMMDMSMQNSPLPLQIGHDVLIYNSPIRCRAEVVDATRTSTALLSKMTQNPLVFLKPKQQQRVGVDVNGVKRRTFHSSLQSSFKSSDDGVTCINNNDEVTESSLSSNTDFAMNDGGCCSSTDGDKKRSCLKVTQQSINASTSNDTSIPSNASSKNKNKKKKSVHFGKGKFSKYTEFYIVPTFVDEQGDLLWWSTSELEQCRKEQIKFSDAPGDTKRAVKNFLDSYETMHKEFYECKSNSTKKYQIHLSTDQYYRLTKGYAYGFIGLEKLLHSDTEHRRLRNQGLIRQTIEYYRLHRDDDDSVSSFSKTLTSKDRYWAMAMGNSASVASRH